ncbi:hypothetical protein [Mesorhizobium sp. BHbdii]
MIAWRSASSSVIVLKKHAVTFGSRLTVIGTSPDNRIMGWVGHIVSKYFTDREIDAFLDAYLEKYPDAIARMHFVMKHPYRDNDQQISRNGWEVRQVADSLAFFHDYANRISGDILKEVPDKYYHAYNRLMYDVTKRVAEMLGPIGSYEIDD